MKKSEELKRGTRFATPIAHPEWLQDGIESADRVFELAIAGRLPESIAGWMITVACMRVLRSVYGDDLSTVIALRRCVLESAMPLTKEELELVNSDLAGEPR